MKILHCVITDDFAGSENNCAQLAMLQTQAGHEVRVVIKGRNPKQVRRFREIVAKDTLVVLPRRWPSLLDSWLLGYVLRGFEPDIVHTHLGRATRRMQPAAKKAKVPHVASLHLNYEPKVYGACDGLVCVAGWQEATLAGYAGEHAVVRNWVPARVAPADNARTRLRAAVGASADTLVFGSVGRIDMQKGYDVLVQAFDKAYPRGDEDVRLVIVGQEGNMGRDVAALAENDTRITLVGYSTEVPAWLSAFDVFVSSSRFEGLALVLLEAMGARLPLLVTDVKGNRELADLQKPGVVQVVAPENVDELAEGLKAMKGRSRTDYDLSALNPATVAERVEALYQRVLARSETKAPRT
ncbi:MAG: glycosyltransferase [Alphaproteobacteria bacterium]|nr:MAG: glycosyltransferase [Alphaproteobacteria bacterium]